MTDLRERTAVITGGAAGLGLSIAKAFASRGARIVLADMDGDRAVAAAAALTADGAQALGVRCDVTEERSLRDAADAALERFGKVHVIVNNAGVSVAGDTGRTPLTDWAWIIDINLMGVVRGVEIFTPLIQSHGEGGHILNVASMAGHHGAPTMGPYNATKFAVVGYSEALAPELEPQGIGVSVLCPGFARTQIHASALNAPSRRSGSATADPADAERMAFFTALVEGGVSADLVGEAAARGVEAGRLFIFTHPELKALVEERSARMLADYDAGIAALPEAQ